MADKGRSRRQAVHVARALGCSRLLPVLAVPAAVIAATVLPEMLLAPAAVLLLPIPYTVPPMPLDVTVTEPVPVAAPMVLPVMSARPPPSHTAHQMPGTAEVTSEVDQEKFAKMLPVMVEVAPLPTLKDDAKRLDQDPLMVHAEPAHSGAEPPT